MKNKLLLFLALFLMLPRLCFAAMSASIIWEFRDTATANMANGGGFKIGASGVDHSTDNSAVTNWSKTDGTSNASTTFTSATATFDANIVGNILHLISGTNGTVGWYEVTAYTDANTITLDRNCSTGAMTDGVFNVGGALNVGSLEDSFFEQCVAGQIVYVKSGTYTSGAWSVVNDGTEALPITVEGYQTTRGDNPTATNRPLFAMGGSNAIWGDHWIIRNFRFTTTGSLGVGGTVGCILENISSDNSSGTADRSALYANGTNVRFLNCEGISTNGNSIKAGSLSHIIGCYLHNSVDGIEQASVSGVVVCYNVIDTVTNGILLTGASTGWDILNNTFYNCSTAGISGATSTRLTVLNNIFDTCGTGVSFTTQANNNWFDYNNYFNNTTNRTNVMTGDHDTALDPGFTDAANADFRVGANMKATAFPGTFPGAHASCIGYLDQGAVQRVEPTGGSAAGYNRGRVVNQ